MENQIVVGVDDSGEAREALRWAGVEADRRGIPIAAVLVWQPPLYATSAAMYGAVMPPDRSILQAAERILDEVVRTTPPPSGVTVTQQVTEGSPGSVLLDILAYSELLVVGSRGRGSMTRIMLGSVSRKCAVHATGPVVIVPQGSGGAPREQRVVVGYDGSANADAALRWATDRAVDGDRIVAVSADHEREPVPELQVDGVEHRVVAGDPRDVLHDAAQDADLLVVGARGHSGIAGMLIGSTTLHVIEHPHTTTAVVPAPAPG